MKPSKEPRRGEDAARLARAMAHDARNALNAIVLHTDLLERGCKRSGDERGQRAVAAIGREVERLDGILARYLAIVVPEDEAEKSGER